MLKFKKIIAEEISKVTNIKSEELETYIEIPKETNNGDYSFPCFRLAKELKKAPQIIATDLKEKIKIVEPITKIEVIGGYLNFFIKVGS